MRNLDKTRVQELARLVEESYIRNYQIFKTYPGEFTAATCDELFQREDKKLQKWIEENADEP